jgi:hypothetical protein
MQRDGDHFGFLDVSCGDETIALVDLNIGRIGSAKPSYLISGFHAFAIVFCVSLC